MKIQLDYDNKQLTLENNVSMDKFFQTIKKILPDWKEWTLTTSTVINNWQNPIYIPYTRPLNPWWGYPQTTFDINTDLSTYPETGTFCLNIQ